MYGVSNARFSSRKARPPVFMDAQQPKRSASLATQNIAGNDYVEVPSGTVIARCHDDLHRPCAYDTAQSAVAGANDVVVADSYQFRVGDVVELPESVVEGADRFRAITAIDYDTDTLTLGGSTFSLSEDDPLIVDPSRAFGEVETTAGAPGTATTTIALLDGHAARFEVGDTVEVGAAVAEQWASTLTYEAGVVAFAEVEVFSRVTGERVAAAEVAHAQATDAATSVGQIATLLNDELPANTAVASSSGDDLIVTAEDVDYRLELTLGFEDASSADWTEPTRSLGTQALEITALDTGADTITVDGDIAVTDGERVAGPARGGYKIGVETVIMDYGLGMQPDNVMMTYRTHGEARKESVLGLFPDAKAALEPMVEFTSLHG